MFCAQCGTNVADDSRFCRSCGKTLGVVSTGGGAAAAVAPARVQEPETKTASANWWMLPIIVLAVLGVVWLIVAASAGHKPMDLGNQTVKVPAHSWYALTIQIPYDGSVAISAAVQSGNPMMIYLTDEDGFKALELSDRNTFWNGFAAQHTLDFEHTGRLQPGTFHLIMRDYSLGLLSKSSSDVLVKVHIEP
jgi:hypothetical protein